MAFWVVVATTELEGSCEPMRVVAVVQARMGSTRLPGKVLKPLRGRPVLEHVLKRVQQARLVSETVLATTVLEEDNELASLALALGAQLVRGPVDDVLTRYAMAATTFGAEHVVRITADCPCIDPEIIDRVVEAHLGAEVDYTSNTHPRSFPHGLDVEVVSKSALMSANDHAKRPEDREHVTSFIWSQPGRFRLLNVAAKPEETMPELRVTLDTPEDYAMLQAVFDLLETDDFHAVDLVRLVRRYPWLTRLNAGVRQKLPPIQEPITSRIRRELITAAEWAADQELPWAARVLLEALEQPGELAAQSGPDLRGLRARLQELRAALLHAEPVGERESHV